MKEALSGFNPIHSLNINLVQNLRAWGSTPQELTFQVKAGVDSTP